MKLEAILKRIDKTTGDHNRTGCWLWIGAIDSNGYGVATNADNATRGAHRVVYELEVGPIPDGYTIHHRCYVRNCVNPAHLEPLTSEENTSDVVKKCRFPQKPNKAQREATARWRAGVCRKGHLLSEFGTVVRGTLKDGSTQTACRKCRQDVQSAHRARNGVEVSTPRGSYGARDADLPKSGIKGISWATAPQRWRVAFYFKGKSYYNGEYKSLSDAELALSELKSRLGVV